MRFSLKTLEQTYGLETYGPSRHNGRTTLSPNILLDRAANVMYGMFSCNGWGIGIVLQVSRDSINPIEKG